MTERPYRLSARFVETVQQPGRYGDGRGSGGLSLRVKRTTRGHLSKSWGQRISVDGRPRNLGLGTWPHVSLAEARQKCALNLLARQRGELVTGRRRTVPTVAEAVEKVIAVHAAGWKDGGRQEKLWRASLRDYAMPQLGGAAREPDPHTGRDAGSAADLEPEAGDGEAGTASDLGGDAVTLAASGASWIASSHAARITPMNALRVE